VGVMPYMLRVGVVPKKLHCYAHATLDWRCNRSTYYFCRVVFTDNNGKVSKAANLAVRSSPIYCRCHSPESWNTRDGVRLLSNSLTSLFYRCRETSTVHHFHSRHRCKLNKTNYNMTHSTLA